MSNEIVGVVTGIYPGDHGLYIAVAGSDGQWYTASKGEQKTGYSPAWIENSDPKRGILVVLSDLQMMKDRQLRAGSARYFRPKSSDEEQFADQLEKIKLSSEKESVAK